MGISLNKMETHCFADQPATACTFLSVRKCRNDGVSLPSDPNDLSRSDGVCPAATEFGVRGCVDEVCISVQCVPEASPVLAAESLSGSAELLFDLPKDARALCGRSRRVLVAGRLDLPVADDGRPGVAEEPVEE